MSSSAACSGKTARVSWRALAASVRKSSETACSRPKGPARVRQAYPGKTYDRLVAIKRRYDPTNLFHRNQNIPPGGD